MTIIAVFLITLAIADTSPAPDYESKQAHRVDGLTLTLVGLGGVVLSYVSGISWLMLAIIPLALAVSAPAHRFLRHLKPEATAIETRLEPLLLVVGFFITGAVAAVSETEQVHLVSEFFDRTPFNPSKSLIVITVIGFLGQTSNRMVRFVLSVSTPSNPGSETTQGSKEEEKGPVDTIKGGRWVGPLERMLIFGFVVTGAATAAAFVVSAKALLRYPEISKSESRIHETTEYVLIGSLLSWTIALATSWLTVAGWGT